MVEGLCHLHRLGVVHSDISPQNVFLRKVALTIIIIIIIIIIITIFDGLTREKCGRERAAADVQSRAEGGWRAWDHNCFVVIKTLL
jgi:hypothetical protein